ncbi:MAG: hypothetical protein EOM11_10850 [Erysipelotrichia bacterium]|nr:hypothetical protein [Erysipelotrichia bacterium]
MREKRDSNFKTQQIDQTLIYNKIPRFTYNAIDDYVEVDNPDEWLECPECGAKPIIWEYDNGRSTACKCGKNIYDHFSIYAESIMSFITRNNGSVVGYDGNALRDNWNHWCKTKEIIFVPSSERW